MNRLANFNHGKDVGLWLLMAVAFPVSVTIIGANIHAGAVGIQMMGFLDYAGWVSVPFSYLISAAIILTNVAINYRIGILRETLDQESYWNSLMSSSELCWLTFFISASLLSDTLTTMCAMLYDSIFELSWAYVGFVLSRLVFSVGVYTFLSEILLITSIGILFANWQYVKPLFSANGLSNVDNKSSQRQNQNTTPQSSSTTNSTIPTFQGQNNQNQQNRGR